MATSWDEIHEGENIILNGRRALEELQRAIDQGKQTLAYRRGLLRFMRKQRRERQLAKEE